MQDFSTNSLQNLCRKSDGYFSPPDFNNDTCSKCLQLRFLINENKFSTKLNQILVDTTGIYKKIAPTENSNESWIGFSPDPESESSQICDNFFDSDPSECKLWKLCCRNAKECCEKQLLINKTTKGNVFN